MNISVEELIEYLKEQPMDARVTVLHGILTIISVEKK